MAHNFSRPSHHSPSQSIHQQQHDNPPHDKRRPPPLQQTGRRRAAAMSPTFHLDPERSSSSDNGSLAHPFPFPPASYHLPQGPRDSVTTHHSSIYPQSTSSYSNTSPPSPSSPSEASFAASIQTFNTDGDATSLDPHHPHHAMIDPDDVSYRLRLLVRNNYFLPPAHSKPSQSELAAAAEQSQTGNNLAPLAQKSASTSFRDMFRVGKARNPVSRPATATSQAQQQQKNSRHIAPPPPLRQVKSANPIMRPSHTRVPTSFSGSATSSRALSVTATGGPVERRGRVVVIREKVEDLAVAAKEAEIQMRVQQQEAPVSRPKSSGGRRPKSASSKKSVRVEFEDDEFVIDPTDAVDLPSYGFEPQASAFVGLGLGVDASGLSAGVLADQLPPPTSLDLGLRKEDMLWRKALLHQAVGLSMLSIPAKTPSSSPHSTPNASRLMKPSPASPFGGASSSLAHTSSPTSKPKSPVLPIVEDLDAAAGSGVVSPTAFNAARSRKISNTARKDRPLPVGEATGRGRSASHPALPKSPTGPAGPPESTRDGRAVRARPSSRHRASPAPQRSETPSVPSQALQPPPRRMTLGVRPDEPSIPQSPLGGDIEISAQKISQESIHPMRAHSPLFPPADAAGETIRKTLTRPLLSEGYETEHTTRSSEYFTPFSPSLIVQSPSGGVKPLRRRRSRGSFSSGSDYSRDAEANLQERAEADDQVRDLTISTVRSDTSSHRRAIPVFTPTSGEMSGTRESHEGSSLTRQSVESSAMAPRVSMAESHVSLFSTSFGPLPGRTGRSPSRTRSTDDIRPSESLRSNRLSEDMIIQPPPPELMMTAPSTGSEVGLHSLGGVAEIQPPGPAPFTGPIPRPARSATTPSARDLASRRAHIVRPLDLLTIASMGPSDGARSAPLVGRDHSSFLDLEIPHSAVGWGSREEDAEEPIVYVDAASKSRSRLSSSARTVVPSPKKSGFAPDDVANTPEQPIVMRFANTSNPYLQNPYADIDPTRPLTNTPAVPQEGFLSSAVSTLSNLTFLGARKDSQKRKEAAAIHPLANYAKDPRAQSTPILSPSKKVFTEAVAPGRHSNVGDSRNPASVEAMKLEGMMAQHMLAERDLLKKVTRNVARADRE